MFRLPTGTSGSSPEGVGTGGTHTYCERDAPRCTSGVVAPAALLTQSLSCSYPPRPRVLLLQTHLSPQSARLRLCTLLKSARWVVVATEKAFPRASKLSYWCERTSRMAVHTAAVCVILALLFFREGLMAGRCDTDGPGR